MPKPIRRLPDLTPSQVVAVQDALLANADELLTSALAVLDLGNVALARSLAILGVEESGKAIAIHDRRVHMAYAPEGEPFVTDRLCELWASHHQKLKLVYDFLVQERYWFGTGPSDPEENRAYLGTLKAWTRRHDNLKKRGFYVELDKVGNALTPAAVADEESLRDVIGHIHQIGWQLRLGEHIEGKRQAEAEAGMPPSSEADIEHWRKILADMNDTEFVEDFVARLREGIEGDKLNNDAYRIKLPEPGSDPFATMGKPGYEAQTRELLQLWEELEERDGG